MDAVHAIRDDSGESIVREICAKVQAGPGVSRHVHIVVENEANQASLLERFDGRPRAATAQWNDDLHHAVHVLSTGETEGYYADYENAPFELFARSLAEGFIFQGQASTFLKGQHRGEPSAHLPSGAFVSFLQTHDQIGNRALGERLHVLGDLQLIRAARACLLLSPHVPMFFMGEEYAAATPFQFFCDFGPELAQAVTEGRRKEFSHFGAFSGEGQGVVVPDPNAKSTFEASKLRWAEREQTMNSIWLGEARALLALRRERIIPLLAVQQEGGQYRTSHDGTIWVEWTFPGSGRTNATAVKLSLIAHFGGSLSAEMKWPSGRIVYSQGAHAEGTAAMTLDQGGVLVMLQDMTSK
jgi:maltooligosyltrehalose trehalohydrolase